MLENLKFLFESDAIINIEYENNICKRRALSTILKYTKLYLESICWQCSIFIILQNSIYEISDKFTNAYILKEKIVWCNEFIQ